MHLGQPRQRAGQAHRATAVRRVGVAGDDVHDALAREGEHPLGGGVLEVRGRSLHEGAAPDEQRQPLDEVGGEVALGVGDEAAQTAGAEVVDRRRQRVRQRSRARLEEQPASGAPERQRPQLGVVEALDDRLGDLGSGQHPGARSRGLQRGVELGRRGPAARRCARRGRGGCAGSRTRGSTPSASAWRPSRCCRRDPARRRRLRAGCGSAGRSPETHGFHQRDCGPRRMARRPCGYVGSWPIATDVRRRREVCALLVGMR